MVHCIVNYWCTNTSIPYPILFSGFQAPLPHIPLFQVHLQSRHHFHLQKHNSHHHYQILFFSLIWLCKKKKNKKNSCLQRENLTITLFILLLKWHHFKIIEFVLDFLQLRFEVNNSFDVFLFSSMFRQNLDHYKDKKKICLWRNSRLFRHSDTQFKISLMHEYQAFLELLNSHLKIAKIHGIFTHF